jgi:tricorn protease-like protein
MSLDVSPDGTEIAFDMLGDIYVIPIDGGEARQLTEGMAWNMQPRYSPDGRWIAFTSDRAGGDNIWVMDRDGSNPRQVTNESFRLLNGPAWTPDSEYIVARKHFTSARSLGAGEMWLYHRDGGTSGLQLTERPNDQKDVNEPVFSPDGRYLYFSQDVTPGGSPSSTTRTRTRDLRHPAAGPGDRRPDHGHRGARGRHPAHPVARRRTLAFIRSGPLPVDALPPRPGVGARVAHLRRTGPRPPGDLGHPRGLPGMAWTPDSGSIVFWAGAGSTGSTWSPGR